jgi:hypothetical protein
MMERKIARMNTPQDLLEEPLSREHDGVLERSRFAVNLAGLFDAA